MKLSHLSSVSALALVLAVGAPHAYVAADGMPDEPVAAADATPDGAITRDDATADVSPDAATTPDEETADLAPDAAATPDEETADLAPDAAATPDEADEPAVTAQVGPDRMALDELDRKLEEMGVENRELFGGQVALARTSEGDPIILLIGPEGFERGEVVEFGVEDFGELREQLTEAGFEEVQQEHALPIMQGTFEDYDILAASGEPQWRPSETRTGAATIDRDQFEEKLGDAGIEDRTEFQGRLLRGFTDDGQAITMLIGPSGFEGDEEIDLSADELRDRFEEAGMTDVRVIEDNIYMMRGSYDDRSVLAFGGQGLADSPLPTGAVRPASQPEIESDLPDPGDVEVEVDPEEAD